MPRAPRIEFEGAIYHVMARGNRREPIVFEDSDRKLFRDTFAEACCMTGWEVFAWVLLDNHYHAVFRTPQANLVEGMKWLQNTFTRRINAKHQLWGHLFGGRYRSILVENREYGGSVWRDYLRTVIDYVHLNPGRAGLVDGVERSASSYPWSSLANGFLDPPSKRPSWLAVGEVLDLFQWKDSPKGRHDLVERLDQWIREENGEPSTHDQTYEDRLKQGWYWGSEAFKEAMLERFPSKSNRTYQSSEQVKDHHERDALEIIEEAKRHFGVSGEELRLVKKGDLTRAAVAWRIFHETTVPQAWIAEQLNMKSAPNVCRQIRLFKQADSSAMSKEVKQWKKHKNF